MGATIRLGGLVAPGSIVRASTGLDLRFTVTDGDATVPVHASAVPPAMFREGIGVVVEGTMRKDGVFESRRLMVKHDNEYRAPGDGEERDIRELMRSLDPEAAGWGHRRMTPSLGQGLVLLALLHLRHRRTGRFRRG